MGQESRRKSFVFYTEWKEVLVDYPPEVRLEVYDAVIEYAESGTLSELRPLAKMAFSFIKKQIDSNKDKYDDIIAKRSEAGKRGMASRYNKDVTKDSKSNKCYHKVTNLTSDNKSNKGYQSVTNLTINDYENDNDDVLFQKEEEKVFGSFIGFTFKLFIQPIGEMPIFVSRIDHCTILILKFPEKFFQKVR